MEKEGFSIGVNQPLFFKGMIKMKKLTTLLLAAGMIFAASAPASAVDVKMDGEWIYQFVLGEQPGSGQNYDKAGQRLRLGVTYTASEALSGYLQLQIGSGSDSNANYDWGSDVTGRAAAVGMRQAYIDWLVPQTAIKVRMGRQLVGLPEDAFGKNAVMNPSWSGRDGITVSSPVTDWLDLTAFWVRGNYKSAGNDTVASDKSDYFALMGAFKFDGFSFTPYVMYASLDRKAVAEGTSDLSTDFGTAANVSASGNAYWFGSNFVMTYFDPFVLKVSGAYGVANYEGSPWITPAKGDAFEYSDANMNNREGWYIQTKASYKTAYGTPILGAWYASGDDSNAQYARQGWIPTNNGRFHPTFGYMGGGAGLYNTNSRHNIGGTWGVQAGIEDVSFLEDLSHKFTVTLFKGTNSAANAAGMDPTGYMTASDSVVEFNLSSTYKIYKNLSAVLELAYLINDYDEGDHYVYANTHDMDKDSWSASLLFTYKF